MDVPFQPCTVMNDFKEGNANHDQVGGRWRVTGLFDLMEFYSGDGEMDLSRQACEYFSVSPKLTATFVKSYLAMRPARPGFSERFRLYAAADRLTIWSHGVEHGWFQKGQTLRNWIEPSLDMESHF
jgi:fructosamine-3-kinase